MAICLNFDFNSRYAQLKNEAARLDGASNAYEAETKVYDYDDFDGEMRKVLDGVMPMFRQLHAYVRHRLEKR